MTTHNVLIAPVTAEGTGLGNRIICIVSKSINRDVIYYPRLSWFKLLSAELTKINTVAVLTNNYQISYLECYNEQLITYLLLKNYYAN